MRKYDPRGGGGFPIDIRVGQGAYGTAPAPLAVVMMIALIGFAMMPPFMVATLAFDIRGTFPLGDNEIGALVATFFLSSALMSRRAGALAEHDGAATSLVLAALMCTVSISGLGLASPNVTMLYVWCVIAGVGNALAHVSVNLLFVRRVAVRRRGLTFGFKQAAIPLASLAAGLAVPLARLLGTWQRVFMLFAVLSTLVLLWALMETRGRRGESGRRRDPIRAALPSRRVLVLLALGAGLGVAPMTVVASYVVVAGVAGNLTPTEAALTLAAGSLVAIVIRITFGWAVDTRVANGRSTGVPALIVGTLLTSMLFLLLMDASVPWRFSLGATVGLGLGWAWHGLMDYSVVRLYPDSPGRATGISQVGAYLGGILGPLAGGVYFERIGFELAWRLCAILVAGAALSFAMAAIAAHRSSKVDAL